MTATVGDTSKRDVAITLNLKWVEVVMESSKKNAQHASECVSLHVITLPCFGPLPKYFIISAAFLSNPAITQMKHVVIHAKNTSMPLYFTCMSILNLNWNDFHWNSLSHNRCPCGLQGERSINLTHTHTDTTHTQLFLFLYSWFCIYNQAPEEVHGQINGPSLETANSMQNLCIQTLF